MLTLERAGADLYEVIQCDQCGETWHELSGLTSFMQEANGLHYCSRCVFEDPTLAEDP